jgi:hypothetical protein
MVRAGRLSSRPLGPRIRFEWENLKAKEKLIVREVGDV